MTEEEFTILIEKFLQNALSSSEEEQLLKKLEEDPVNVGIFNDHVDIHHKLQKSRKFDVKAAYSKIQNSLKDPKPSRNFKSKFYLKYAAVFVAVLGAAFYFTFHSVPGNKEALPNAITLELGNGELHNIELTDQKTGNDLRSRLAATMTENSLNYENVAPTEKMVYNRLWVPFGKTFNLILSDGTKIILNSGTSIKYPVFFLPNEKREVFLNGEAFFVVTKDPENSFAVQTEGQQVEVYGTEFNVSAYGDDPLTRTVLVEGSVGVNYHNSQVKLVPGEMALTKKGERLIEVKRVDPQDHIAWLQNEIVFVSRSFSEITRILERKFDVTIINEYKALDAQVFTGSFKDKSLEEILEFISKSRPFIFKSKEGTENEKKTFIIKKQERK